MSKDEDSKVRSLFERLRQEDEGLVPEFHKVLHKKGSSPGAAVWSFRLRPAIVLLLLIFIAGPVLYFSLRDADIREREMASDLEEWESPTDFLLSFNDSSIDSSLPEIGTGLWEGNDFSDFEN